MEIRHAKIDDIPAIVRLGEAMHRASSFADMEYSREVATDTAVDCVIDPNRVALVAVDEQGKIAGMFLGAVMRSFFGPDLVASDLATYISPKRRGQRTADRMLRAYVEWAKARGAKRINVGNSAGMNDELFVKLTSEVGFEKAGSLMYRGA